MGIAQDMFQSLGVWVFTGNRFIGDLISSSDDLQNFVSKKVHK